MSLKSFLNAKIAWNDVSEVKGNNFINKPGIYHVNITNISIAMGSNGSEYLKIEFMANENGDPEIAGSVFHEYVFGTRREYGASGANDDYKEVPNPLLRRIVKTLALAAGYKLQNGQVFNFEALKGKKIQIELKTQEKNKKTQEVDKMGNPVYKKEIVTVFKTAHPLSYKPTTGGFMAETKKEAAKEIKAEKKVNIGTGELENILGLEEVPKESDVIKQIPTDVIIKKAPKKVVKKAIKVEEIQPVEPAPETNVPSNDEVDALDELLSEI